MKTTRRSALLLFVLAALLLAGCGNKGDLVRPSDAPEPAAGT
jgi:predicted small lipoprotein YifL